jgi:hypothetical protein
MQPAPGSFTRLLVMLKQGSRPWLPRRSICRVSALCRRAPLPRVRSHPAAAALGARFGARLPRGRPGARVLLFSLFAQAAYLLLLSGWPHFLSRCAAASGCRTDVAIVGPFDDCFPIVTFLSNNVVPPRGPNVPRITHGPIHDRAVRPGRSLLRVRVSVPGACPRLLLWPCGTRALDTNACTTPSAAVL